MRKCITLLFAMLITFSGFSREVEMADTMRSEGKIYVVVAIILIILVGLIGYLILIDRKTSRLEKKLDQKTSD